MKFGSTSFPPLEGEGEGGVEAYKFAPALNDHHPTRPWRDTLPLKGREGHFCRPKPVPPVH